MKYRFPLFHKEPKQLNKRDDEVFVQASELAQLRLEQWMADRQSASLPEWKPLSSSQGQGGRRQTRWKLDANQTAASLR